MNCPLLENLSFHDVLPEMLSVYPQIVRACHALKTLSVTGTVHDARQIVQAVFQYHTKNITRVRWTGGGGFLGGLNMEEFLRLCPSLERFETRYTLTDSNKFTAGQGATGSMWINDGLVPLPSPNEVVPMYWVCHATLTHLDVTFYPMKNISDKM
ncbi:hypothetical protein BGZ65_002206, partial [Modicella reniformis]